MDAVRLNTEVDWTDWSWKQAPYSPGSRLTR